MVMHLYLHLVCLCKVTGESHTLPMHCSGRYITTLCLHTVYWFGVTVLSNLPFKIHLRMDMPQGRAHWLPGKFHSFRSIVVNSSLLAHAGTPLMLQQSIERTWLLHDCHMTVTWQSSDTPVVAAHEAPCPSLHTCLELGQEGHPPVAHGHLSGGWYSPGNDVMGCGLTTALKENRDTGIFSGPPWTSKCLQPALALTYVGLSSGYKRVYSYFY